MLNKSKCRKITALLAAAAMTFSLAGCGEDTIYIGTSQDKDIPSGLYIYYLLNAYYSAQSYMTETDTDVFAITIEEQPARDWMISTAKSDLVEYLAIEQKFDEYGLELTEDETEAAKINIDSMWEYYGSVYESYGIAESSFLKAYENTLKADKLFDTVYGEDGEREVPEDDIRAYMIQNYALINYISMNLVDGEGNLLKSDGKAERMEMAKDYVERAKNGEDFDSLNFEYLAYIDKLTAEAQAAAAAAAAEEAEGDTSSNELSVVPSDAEEMAPAEESGEVTSETSAETEAETVGETTAETTVTEAETTSEETAEETTASAVWAGEETAEETETDVLDLLTEEEEETTYESNKQVISKDGSEPAAIVCEKVFSDMNAGDVTIIESEDGEYYYVVAKYDLLDDPTYFISAKESLLYEMREDDFEALKKEWADSVDFAFNEKALERYLPEKFAEEAE
ncbi:MAG: hypothetical protein SOU50_04220 [Oscillospiraceae bacterium]|nr:hypothetical protein [Oscillospiraceae bacterium]